MCQLNRQPCRVPSLSPQETPHVSTHQVFWEGPGSSSRQAPRPRLCSWLRSWAHARVWLWVRAWVRQVEQHPVSSRGVAETTEGCGGRHRSQEGKDPWEINATPSPRGLAAAVCVLSVATASTKGQKRSPPLLLTPTLPQQGRLATDRDLYKDGVCHSINGRSLIVPKTRWLPPDSFLLVCHQREVVWV